MIFLDYKPFATNSEFNIALNETKYTSITTQKAIFDEIHIIENATTPVTTDKLQWQYDTVFLWLCNSLEAGNISLSGEIPINNLKIRRKKKDELVFEDIKLLNYDVDIQTYEFKDKFVESLEDYVYAIQPLGGSTESPIVGDNTIAEVYCEFESTWIIGKDKQYKLMYDLSVGDYETIMPSGLIETIGSRFPIVTRNGNIKYKKGSLKCKLISDATIIAGNTNAKEEKKYRKAIEAFLTDNKPKLYKDGSGQMMVISLMDAPTLSPVNELNQLIYDISINFVEVSDTDTISLINSGLLVV